MIVLKFGGTSVGNAENIKKVANIVNTIDEQKIIVLSAVAGTTNALVAIHHQASLGAIDQAKNFLNKLETQYHELVDQLYDGEYYQLKALTFVRNEFDHLRSLIESDKDEEKTILAQGELIATHLFGIYQQEQKQECQLINALDFMAIDENSEPNKAHIKENIHKVLADNISSTYVTQGFICRNHYGNIDNLKRGGSDYTASLIGAAVNAKEIQIWTDISGMHNNDPRFVTNTYSINEISFNEAAELAYFGAKILHPQSVIPAKENNIPVLLKNTFKPLDNGTVIKNCNPPSAAVRAIAAKDGIIAVKIKSYRMLMAYGFLKKVFEIFERHKTAIDMITTSEVAVSITIDDATHLNAIEKDLQEFGTVEIDTNMSIICLAGDFSETSKGVSAQVLHCLKEIPLRMISYGGSRYNMSILIDTAHKVEALNLLNKGLFTKTIVNQAALV